MSPDNRPSLWRVERLAKNHARAAFSCGNETLDHYLKELAGQDARRHVAAPFVLVTEADRKTVLGYYTLSSFSVELGDLPAALAKKLPSYPLVPVTLLGRLAVDRRHKGRKLGEFLLIDALQRAYHQSAQIAAAAVVVDAIDESAEKFYKHFDFIPLPDRPNRLFLPMKTIAALFSSKP